MDSDYIHVTLAVGKTIHPKNIPRSGDPGAGAFEHSGFRGLGFMGFEV